MSDRSWATVREDYSPDGDAWGFLPHDLARSKAYRWGEDGIAGLCDRYQLLVFAPAFWNGRDPILKERLFGLTGPEGNHGEDVKEYYFYLDNTPTHSYMKFLYKYPQGEFPYRRARRGEPPPLVARPRVRADRHRDLRRRPLLRHRRRVRQGRPRRTSRSGSRRPTGARTAAPLHILPHLWFRNTWSWGPRPGPEPEITPGPSGPGFVGLATDDSEVEELTTVPVSYRLGPRVLFAPDGGVPLFTDNETNVPRVFGPGQHSRKPFVKDAFHRRVVQRRALHQPGPDRHEGRDPLPLRRRPARRLGRAPAPADRPRRPGGAPG